jgi:cardiolipin synthase (CMP-forming)
LVLASLGFNFEVRPLLAAATALVAALTLLSIAAYLREWVRHMGSDSAGN